MSRVRETEEYLAIIQMSFMQIAQTRAAIDSAQRSIEMSKSMIRKSREALERTGQT